MTDSKRPDTIRFKLVKGREISHYINEVAELRIEIFKDFPYLYDGDLSYEKKYLQTYVNSDRSLLILVFDGEKVIGASTALPLDDETNDVKSPFIENSKVLKNIFYFGESILKTQYRRYGIGKDFFKYREQHALSFGQYRTTCFCAVNRSLDDKNKPTDYVPLDSFWNSLGYKKENQIVSSFSWRDIGDQKETRKSMIYWTKEWSLS